MKKVLFLIVAIISSLTSCVDHTITGSGKIVTENRICSNFTEIAASESIDVELSQGTTWAVTVEADDNVVNYLHTDVDGNKLTIYLDDRLSITNGHLKVIVTSPEITSVRASSSSTVVVKGLIKSGKKVMFQTSSSASLFAEVNASEIDADASSSSTIKLVGNTMYFNANSTSSAKIMAFELIADSAKVEASSSGSINVYTKKELYATASSAGEIFYKAATHVESDITSGGSVERIDDKYINKK